MKLICQRCKKHYDSVNEKQKYCSLKCYWHRPSVKRACLHCKKIMTVKEADKRKYCSMLCCAKSKSRRNKISSFVINLHKERPKEKWYKNKNKTSLEMSERMKNKWKDPVYAAHIISKTRAPLNKVESKTLDMIKEIDTSWEFVGDGKFIIGNPPKNPDFINRDKKLILEVFGAHWHNKNEIKVLKNHYAKYGFDCVVVWDYEIIPMQHCEELNELISMRK